MEHSHEGYEKLLSETAKHQLGVSLSHRLDAYVLLEVSDRCECSRSPSRRDESVDSFRDDLGACGHHHF